MWHRDNREAALAAVISHDAAALLFLTCQWILCAYCDHIRICDSYYTQRNIPIFREVISKSE